MNSDHENCSLFNNLVAYLNLPKQMYIVEKIRLSSIMVCVQSYKNVTKGFYYTITRM